jgi:hypothetical protein
LATISDIPECLAALDRDKRGYPIPVTVARGRDGTPYFTITDPEARHRLLKEDRCHISGRKLLRGRWLIGGPSAAFHPQGAFLDGPMLEEAALFSVRTCPYIAAPKYLKRIDDAQLQNSSDADMLAIRFHEEVLEDRPPLFVRLMTTGQKLVPSSDGGVLIVPKRPYSRVEFWQHGKLLDFHEGVQMAVVSGGGAFSEKDVYAISSAHQRTR